MSGLRRPLRAGALAALMLFFLASVVRADSALDARYFDARGRAHFAVGDFPRALQAFLHAHRIAPSAATLYNVALTAQLSSEAQLAWSFFEQFLTTAPAAATQREEAARRQAEVQSALTIVQVTSDPPRAHVFVDRRDHGEHGVTPLRVALVPGDHRILVETRRYRTYEVDVSGHAGEATQVHATLAPIEGRVRFVGAPLNARVELRRDDGELREVAGESHTLLVGHYEARLVSDAFVAAPVLFEVREGSDIQVRIIARPLPTARAEMGRLVVRSTPQARVTVEGVAQAQTPVVFAEVPAGARRIRVEAVGYQTLVREVEIRSGESTHLDVGLTPLR